MIVVFVDLAGFTALTEAHGDELATEILDDFAIVVNKAVSKHGLRNVKAIGDAFLLTGEDATASMAAAIEIVSEMSRKDRSPSVRVGMHAGDVIEREGDIVGGTVNVAARVAGEASAGEILVTREALALGAPPSSAEPASVGKRRLRNLPQPVELLDISPTRERGQLVDPVCRMKLRPEQAAGSFKHEGTTYYFCSKDCLAAFIGSPGSYVQS
jgi:adenylate cyclase